MKPRENAHHRTTNRIVMHGTLALALTFIIGCEGSPSSRGNETEGVRLGAVQDDEQARSDDDNQGSADTMNTTEADEIPTVKLRVFDASGTLTDAVDLPRVVRSDEEWKQILTPEQFRVVRSAGTERPFCGALLDNKIEGVYTCVACNLPLFASNAKFESGTGWPSFFQPIATENVAEKSDYSHGMTRVEINCARCDGHLGHVFHDGPRPTGLRFCLNSESLAFTGHEDLKTLADPALASVRSGTPDKTSTPARARAVFAGGCFWCVEAVFEELDGVIDAVSGYAGDTAETANYKAVGAGRTKHAEAVEIVYDPTRISFEELLLVHFATHDPTTLNRQGADQGPQYRSAIFYADEREKAYAQAVIDDLSEQKVFGDKRIVTTLEPLEKFYEAESYHQNYVCNNPMQGYVRSVALPKVEKVRKLFKDRLKAESPLDRR